MNVVKMQVNLVHKELQHLLQDNIRDKNPRNNNPLEVEILIEDIDKIDIIDFIFGIIHFRYFFNNFIM